MTIRRSSTRLLRSSKLRRWTSHALRVGREQVVLQGFDGVVHALHRFEVAVHDVVEQPVQQVADAELGQVGAGVPAVHHRADVQPVVLADGDQRLAGDEGGEFTGRQFAGAGVELCSVGGQEQVAAVAVQLRPLALVDRVLDGQRMQAELLAQHIQVVAVGVAQVQPDGDGRVVNVVADVGDREALEFEMSVPVEPGAGLALGRGDLADGRRRDRFRVAAVERLSQQRPGAQRATGCAVRLGQPARVAGVALRCVHRFLLGCRHFSSHPRRAAAGPER